ncbi:hypothetical protein J3F83DRAFT_642206 [Trichoderma novae-zelandiae]
MAGDGRWAASSAAIYDETTAHVLHPSSSSGPPRCSSSRRVSSASFGAVSLFCFVSSASSGPCLSVLSPLSSSRLSRSFLPLFPVFLSAHPPVEPPITPIPCSFSRLHAARCWLARSMCRQLQSKNHIRLDATSTATEGEKRRWRVATGPEWPCCYFELAGKR